MATIPDAAGAMSVPVIIGSDKTTVSIATGQTEFWPLYISLGNFTNAARRAHRGAVMLIGFLAIPKCNFVPAQQTRPPLITISR